MLHVHKFTAQTAALALMFCGDLRNVFETFLSAAADLNKNRKRKNNSNAENFQSSNKSIINQSCEIMLVIKYVIHP